MVVAVIVTDAGAHREKCRLMPTNSVGSKSQNWNPIWGRSSRSWRVVLLRGVANHRSPDHTPATIATMEISVSVATDSVVPSTFIRVV